MSEVFQIAADAAGLGSLYALLALGIALVFGVMRLINFAHGELLMVGGYALFFLRGQPWPASLITMTAVIVILALAMERVAFRPVREASATTLLVTSFAVSFVLQNLAILTVGARPKAVPLPSFFVESVTVGGVRIPKLDILTLGMTACLLTGLVSFLKMTALGRQMRAAAEDFEMARLLGVRANTVIATAFALSGFLAAAAVVIFLGRTGILFPAIGLGPVLVGFIATVIGGLGSLTGAALGGFLLGSVLVVLQTELPETLRPFRDAFVFGGVIAILLIRPHGLLGQRRERLA
jgi:branched-chain amino acid transport system permease protein